MIKHLIFILSIFISFSVYASKSQNWKVVFEEDPASKKKVCLMISKTKKMQDGQSKTPVYLIYNGAIFFAKTKSNIDLSYPNLGLQIDKYPQHKISVLYKKTSAAFTSNPLKIRKQFIEGLDARLTLGFWPSWPKTSSFNVHFDLREFSNTYKRFLNCRKNGSVD